MKDIDHSGKANGVDGPASITVFIIDHLQHTSAAETFQCLGARIPAAFITGSSRASLLARKAFISVGDIGIGVAPSSA